VGAPAVREHQPGLADWIGVDVADATQGERWLPIEGFEGFYEVSDHGRVRSLDRTIICKNGVIKRRRGVMLQPGRDRNGRLIVNLHGGDGSRRRGTNKVHQLVLSAFVGPRPPGAGGLHWDDNVENNHASNLRWGTHVENMQDCLRNGHNSRAVRTHCPRDHPLRAPNLVPSELRERGRKCMACARAICLANSQAAKGLVTPGSVDLQRLSDIYYAEIMRTNGAAQVRIYWRRRGMTLPLLPGFESAIRKM
jgi:hypothetical protein